LDSPAQTRLSPVGVIALAIACGLAGGYLDVAFIVVKKYTWNEWKTFETAADFPWTVPVSHVVLLIPPCALVALVCLVRPKPISLRTTAWLFAGFAMWAAFLRLPLYAISTLLLALGLGRPLSQWIVALYRRPRQAFIVFTSLVAIFLILAASTAGWRALRKDRGLAHLPAPPANARNLLLIVWDTVRANHLSAYGYDRETTPHLTQWARQGVRFDLVVAPAPWTFASHSSFFTGMWPFQLNTQWRMPLGRQYPTLAEYLASRGYATAAFVGNTPCCSYETGLDRGFAHFEDYPLSPGSLIGRTVPGRWLLEAILNDTDLYAKKWISLESWGAAAIDDAFLDWLGKRRSDRPFFAFLNYSDAHTPSELAPGRMHRFGAERPDERRRETISRWALLRLPELLRRPPTLHASGRL
jgi:hypothetical protein